MKSSVCAFLIWTCLANGMELCGDQKNDFQQENVQWKYIKEDPLEKIYLAGNSEVNEPTLRNQFIVYIIPNIKIGVDTTTHKVCRTIKYNFTICEKLFEKFVVDFELSHDYLIKLRVSNKLSLPFYPYEKGFYLSSDQTLNLYQIIADPFLFEKSICEYQSFCVCFEWAISEGYKIQIRNSVPYLGTDHCFPTISPCIQDIQDEAIKNQETTKVRRGNHCAIF